MTEVDLDQLRALGFRSATADLARAAIEILETEHPISGRGLFYRMVSAGYLPSTDREHYQRLGRITTILREHGVVPFAWIVDGVRSTLKPSSWSGLADFGETVRRAYRKDFWATLPEYVHIFVRRTRWPAPCSR